MHVLDILKERGFLAQITYEDALYEQLAKEPTVFYAFALIPLPPACILDTSSRFWPWRTCSRLAISPGADWGGAPGSATPAGKPTCAK